MAEEHCWVFNAWKAHGAVFAASESSIVTFTIQAGVASSAFFAVLTMITGTFRCIWVGRTFGAWCALFTFVEAFVARLVQFSEHVPLVRSACSCMIAFLAISAKVASFEKWVFGAWHTVVTFGASVVLVARIGNAGGTSTATFALVAVFASWSVGIVEAWNAFFAWFAFIALIAWRN